MNLNRLIPELVVSDFGTSVKFYTEIIGCKVLYERPEEYFVMFDLEGSNIMIEQAFSGGRRFSTAELIHPYGRGMNLQVKVSDIDILYKRCLDNQCTITIPIEEKWYRADNYELGNRQFVVSDPDGYLLRPFKDLGKRTV